MFELSFCLKLPGPNHCCAEARIPFVFGTQLNVFLLISVKSYKNYLHLCVCLFCCLGVSACNQTCFQELGSPQHKQRAYLNCFHVSLDLRAFKRSNLMCHGWFLWLALFFPLPCLAMTSCFLLLCSISFLGCYSFACSCLSPSKVSGWELTDYSTPSQWPWPLALSCIQLASPSRPAVKQQQCQEVFRLVTNQVMMI